VYNPGDEVALTVRLSEPVDVTLSAGGAAPLLKLSNGATAVYKSGSGSEMLEFTYSVGTQDKSSADLGVSGITLPAGTSILSVGTGNSVSLGVANGVLSSTADIEIDTLGPTAVVSVADTVLKAGDSTTVTFTFSEPVGNPQAAIQVSNGTLTDLVTTETGQAGTVWVGTFTPNSGVQAQDISVAVDSSKVRDLAGNAGVGYGASQGIDIDTALPTALITHTTQSTGVRLHTITFSEAVSNLDSQDVQVAGGSKGALEQVDARTYTLAVTPTGTGTDAVVVRIAPGAVTDLAGNANGEISYAKPVDEVNPKVQSVWALDSAGEPATSAAYTNGDQVRLVVKFDELVQIDLTKPEPYLALNNGRRATYVGDGALSSAHEFVYTVQNGDATNSLDTLGISAYAGQITDAAGNQARLVITPSVNNLKSLSDVSVDGLVPSISAISATEGFYQPGAVLSINVQFSEEVTVDQTNGSPVLALSNGKTAAYSAGSGTSRLIFTYEVQDGDQDDAALDALALAENGSVLQDSAGNPANVTIEAGRNNLSSRSSVQVDAEQARIAQISANAGEYKAGESIDISLVFNKAIQLDTTQGEPSLMLSNGAIATYNEEKSSALASVVVFDYVVTTEDFEDEQLTVVALRDGYATFSGFVGGSADLTLPNTNADGETVLGGAEGPVVIDLTPPELTSVSLSDVALRAGERATVTFTFSEAVTGLRLQDLEVDDGTLTNLAPSASDASVWTAVFTPFRDVEASEVQVTVRPVAVRDGANNLSLTQVLSSADFDIDTRYPEVTFTTDMQGQVSAGAVHLTMTFAEPVTWNSPVATSEEELLKVLNIRGGTFVSGSFIETIPGKQWELDIEPPENSILPIRVRLLEGAVDDLAGNPSVASGVMVQQVDTDFARITQVSAPQGVYKADAEINVEVTFSEAVTLEVNPEASDTDVPTLFLNNGQEAQYVNGSGTAKWQFVYTVGAEDEMAFDSTTGEELDLDVLALLENDYLLVDGGGNRADVTVSVSGALNDGVMIDNAAPQILSLEATSGLYAQKHVVWITAEISELVDVGFTATSRPALELSNGGVANYVSGSGGNRLLFKYVVSDADQDASKLEVTGVKHQELITDRAGWAIESEVEQDGALSASSTVEIDRTASALVDVVEVNGGQNAGQAADGRDHGVLRYIDDNGQSVAQADLTGAEAEATYYKAGTVLTLQVKFDDVVTVYTYPDADGNPTKTPTLRLSNGAKAIFEGGSGTDTLSFSYTVSQYDLNSEDLAVIGLSENGSRLVDWMDQSIDPTVFGNTALVRVVAGQNDLAATDKVVIDTRSAKIASVSDDVSNDEDVANNVDIPVVFTFHFDEAVDANTLTADDFEVAYDGVNGDGTSDIRVGNVAKQAVVRVDDSTYELHVTLEDTFKGEMSVSIGQDKFADFAGNLNTTGKTYTQKVDTQTVEVIVTPVAGRFLGSTALVDVYDANGDLLSNVGTSLNPSNGQVTVVIGPSASYPNGYRGPIVVSVRDDDPSKPDYEDEFSKESVSLA